MKYLEDNVVASSTLIHTSMLELERATSAASTTLSNAVNAFNQLNYTKFLENVVEDLQEAEKRQQIQRDMNESQMEMSMLGDIDASTEDDKLRYALELAVHQVTAKTRNAEGGAEDLDSTKDSIAIGKKDKKKEKEMKEVAVR